MRTAKLTWSKLDGILKHNFFVALATGRQIATVPCDQKPPNRSCHVASLIGLDMAQATGAPNTPAAGFAMISIPEAQRIVLQHAQVTQPREVGLQDALGRVLAQDVHAQEPLPPFPASIKVTESDSRHLQSSRLLTSNGIAMPV